jgi:dipeptidyl-peptidase-4
MRFPCLLLLLSLPLGAFAAGTNRFTAEIISQSEPSTNLSRVLWHPSGRQVTYLRSKAKAGRTNTVLFAYDVETREERELFDPTTLTNPVRLSLSSYQWSPAGDAILVTGLSDLWRVPVPGGQPQRLTHDLLAEESPTWSPNGQRVAFVKRNNLYVVDVNSRRLRQLTSDGSDLILNGKLDWVYDEEFREVGHAGRAFEWSPDGRKIVFLRLDQRPVPEYPITDFLRTHPTATRQRYPKAGDSNALPTVCVADATGRARPVRTMRLPANAGYVVPEFTWSPDAKTVHVLTLNRAQDELSVLAWQPARSRVPRVLFQERDRAWIDVFEGPRFLKSGQHFIWLSARDGWLHTYLFSADGWMRHQITRGPWQVEAQQNLGWTGHPYEIDPAGEWIYFAATEKDPRERHLYRIQVDGHGFQRLTTEPGTHFQKLSPDGRYLLESFSSLDRPPALRLLRADGTLVATLEQRADRWKDFAVAQFEFHTLTNAGGARLYGQLAKPADFDPAKKYPVIVYVYGGPHAQVVRDAWPAVSPRHQWLAQEGFLIWSLDNRGSWGRGRAWETAIFKDCGTNELADQLAGLEYLKTLPFVDTNRFGIWGWSYGGYLTLYALTHAPDAFKCGVAGAPVTDWKFYDTIYTERYMRTPKENPTGYKTSSPLVAAGKLKAKLLLIHGTADDNVHMQNTMNFVDALVKVGRPFELQIQPGQKHGFGGATANQFVAEQLVDFFKRNL